MLMKRRSRASRRRPLVKFRPSFVIAAPRFRGRRGRCRSGNWSGRRGAAGARGVSFGAATGARGARGVVAWHPRARAGRQGHRFARAGALSQGDDSDSGRHLAICLQRGLLLDCC